MSRKDRLIQRQQAKKHNQESSSTFIQEQIAEEQQLKDGKVGYVPADLEPLEYIHEGKKHIIPAVTDAGDTMTYHDQHYQVTRLKNGLPIEAKRMQDYNFAYDSADNVDPDNVVTDLTAPVSDEYAAMKEAHHAQHPEED